MHNAVRASFDEAGIKEYSIGGGSILAARAHHRRSYDIDIGVPDDTRMYVPQNATECRFEGSGIPSFYNMNRIGNKSFLEIERIAF